MVYLWLQIKYSYLIEVLLSKYMIRRVDIWRKDSNIKTIDSGKIAPSYPSIKDGLQSHSCMYSRTVPVQL